MVVEMEYSTELWGAASAGRLLTRLVATLEALAQPPRDPLPPPPPPRRLFALLRGLTRKTTVGVQKVAHLLYCHFEYMGLGLRIVA